MKFIVVDENKNFREYLKELITGSHHECLILEDGINTSSAYREYRPDRLLIDIQMKKVNGFKLAENLKSEFPEAAIWVMSDFEDWKLRLKAEKIGASLFIVKENMTEFFNIIEGEEK